MKKLRLLMFCLTVSSLLSIIISAQQFKTPITNDNWIGEYTYTYTEGKTVGGAVPVIEYVLIVSQEGNSLAAHFTADGYQTYVNHAYTATVNGNQLDLYFLKDLTDIDMSGTRRRLKKGQLVGSLVKTTSRGRTRYKYRDGSYQISLSPRNPAFFKKTK